MKMKIRNLTWSICLGTISTVNWTAHSIMSQKSDNFQNKKCVLLLSILKLFSLKIGWILLKLRGLSMDRLIKKIGRKIFVEVMQNLDAGT
ncbi:hypothetical protein J3Q64DRAFT_1747549 [Phycomyces blakesleeanus]|uniref:Secreted protein n=1 Tax=Phycomyces blakesleeanus TaxID=4837 RepID=A0ABR3AWV0_PHYBL